MTDQPTPKTQTTKTNWIHADAGDLNDILVHDTWFEFDLPVREALRTWQKAHPAITARAERHGEQIFIGDTLTKTGVWLDIVEEVARG